jgi:branched-chain amino acid aminotransferase
MSSFSACQWVWKNGTLVPWSQATPDLSSHGLHCGTGVFEGIRCDRTANGPAVFRLDARLRRLFESARSYGISLPYSLAAVGRAVLDVVRANDFSDRY